MFVGLRNGICFPLTRHIVLKQSEEKQGKTVNDMTLLRTPNNNIINSHN